MHHAKQFFKLLIALLVALGLTLFGGLGRLSQGPLRLPVHFSKVRDLVRTQGIDFKEIYLFSPSFYSLPGIMIEDGTLDNSTLYFNAKKIFLTWKLNTFILKKVSWEIKQIRLEEPYLRLKQTDSPAEVIPTDNLKDLISKIQTLPAIQIKQGHISGKLGTVDLPDHTLNATLYPMNQGIKMHFYMNVQPKNQETIFEGTMVLQNHRLKGFAAFHRFKPQEWEDFLPEESKAWTRFYTQTLKGALSMDVTLQQAYPVGTASLKIQTPLTKTLKNDTAENLSIENHLTLSIDNGIKHLHLKTDTTPFAWKSLSELWPPFLSPTVYNWCTKRIQGGKAHPINLNAAFVWDDTNHTVTLKDLKGTLGVKGATATYMDTLPPVIDTQADATFTKNSFIINIPQGHTKDLSIQKSQVRFEKLDTQNPTGTVDLYIHGPLSQTLWVANHPPLNFASDYGFKPADVKGTSQTHLVLKFPTKTTPSLKTINTAVDAQFKDFAFKRDLLGQPLHFDQGTLNLKITHALLSLGGQVRINGEPSTLNWKESLSKQGKFLRQYTIKTPAEIEKLLSFTPQTVQTLFKESPEFSLTGKTFLNLDYLETDKDNALLVLNLDLENNALNIPLFGYKKAKQEKGSAFLRLSFHKGAIEKIDGLHLSGKNLNLKATLLFDPQSSLNQVILKESQVNQSILNGFFKKKGDLNWALDLKGQQVALRPLIHFYKKSSRKGNQDPLDFSLSFSFDKALLKKDMALGNLKGHLHWKKGILESFNTRCSKEGQPVLEASYAPDQNDTVFTFKTSQLYTLLKGLDLTETIYAGGIDLKASRPLHSKDLPFKGTLIAQNLRIKEASVLAKLFSLASLEGIASTLSGEGILFIAGDAEFEYLDHKLAIPHLELTSTGLGITGKGYVHLNEGYIDAEGYIIPANLLNQAIGNIPLIGQLLSGGSKSHKGLVSMSYTMKGPLGDPEIKANPLSVLAPNFIKGLFSHMTGTPSKTPTLEAESKE